MAGSVSKIYGTHSPAQVLEILDRADEEWTKRDDEALLDAATIDVRDKYSRIRKEVRPIEVE